VSADGTRLAAGLADNSVQVINRANPQEVLNLAGHTAAVTDVEFWSDGSKLVSVSVDQTIRVWNPADGAPLANITTPAPIAAVVVQSDPNRIFTAHADNRIRAWDLPAAGAETAAPALEILGHEKPVTSLAILPSAATQLISGSEDGTARIWNVADGQAVQTLAHGAPVTAVALRADGAVVASAGANGIAKLWQVADAKQLVEFKGDIYRDVALADATEDQTVAKQLVTVAQAALEAAQKGVTEREEGLKKAQEAKTQSDTALTEAQTKQPAAQTALDAAKAELAAKPEDEELKKKVAEAEKALQAAVDAVKKATETQLSAQRAVELGEKALAASKQSVDERTAQKTAADEHQTQVDAALAETQQQAQNAVQPLRALAFSADGKQLASAGDDQVVHLWDGNTGRCLETFAGHGAAIAATTFAVDGTLLSAGADQSIIAWETQPGWRLAGWLGPAADAPLELGPSPFVGRVLALAFSPDGKLLATGGGEASRAGELLLWDVATRSVARTFTDAHSDTVLGLEFSRDGKFLLSGAADKFVKIFDVSTGNHVRSFEGHTHHVLDVSWKADGTAIATAGADDQIKVWTVETGEQQRTIGGYSRQVTSIQYLGIGEQIVSSGGDKTVRLHNTGNGKQERAFGGATDFVYSSAVTRDGALVIAGGEDGVLRGWNGADAKSLWNIEPPAPGAADNAQASAQ
jgi:WD40 repeat protein